MKLFVAVLIAASISGLSAQTAQPSSQQNAQQSLQQVLAQKMRELAACNAQLGPLQAMQADAIDGRIVDAAQAKLSFVASFEQANPGKSLDDAFTVVDKAK